MIGACQNAAFCAPGSSTVTWQLYSPAGSLSSERSNRMRECLRLGIQAIRHCDRGGFESFGLSAIESHESHHGLRGGGGALVGLQIDIHIAALAEHARDAGNQLFSVLDQRVDRVGLRPVLFFSGGV